MKEEKMEILHLEPLKREYFITHYSPVPVLAFAGLLLLIGALSGIIHIDAWLALLAFSVLLALLAASVMYTWLFCDTTSISLEADGVNYTQGIFNHNKKKIPLSKIIDASLRRSISDRLLGTATLYIDTAAGKGYDISLRNLPFNGAANMYEKLYSHIKKAHVESAKSGAIIVDGEEHSDVLISCSAVIARDKSLDIKDSGNVHTLQDSELEALVRGHPEIVIIGTGLEGDLFIDDRAREFFSREGVVYIDIPTPKARVLFNDLVSAGKKVNAFFHTGS